MEGTKIEDIKHIYLFFAKIVKSKNIISFKFRKYEECIYNVSITHSPRYLIDMELKKNETLFDKIGLSYDELRLLPQPFVPIKKYLRKNLKEGEDLWWNENIDNKDNSSFDAQNISIYLKSWISLTKLEQQDILFKSFSYFPQLFSKNQNKYHIIAIWLVSHFRVVNHNLRDLFTAVGKIKEQNEIFPQIFKYFFYHFNNFKKHINEIQEEDLIFYWKKYLSNNRTHLWLEIFQENIQDHKFNKNQMAILENYIQKYRNES